MSGAAGDFEGCFVKTGDDATFWLVENGSRRAIHSAEEMYQAGLRPVRTVTAEQLAAIPQEGQAAPAARKRRGGEDEPAVDA